MTILQQKILRKFAPIAAALTTFFVVIAAADAFKKTTEDAYLKDVEIHQQAAKKAIADNNAAKQIISVLDHKVSVLVTANEKLEKDLRAAKQQTTTAKNGVVAAKDSLKAAKTVIDSNVVLTTIVQHQDVVITSQGAEIAVLTAQKNNLSSQVFAKDSVIGVLVASNASLEAVVKTIPKPDKCANKFLFCKLNKPTRVTSFIGGVGATVITAVLLR